MLKSQENPQIEKLMCVAWLNLTYWLRNVARKSPRDFVETNRPTRLLGYYVLYFFTAI